ncbi:YceD family protein [Bacillus testis]|uniref:YceD family protein n=1 Tax=Bacillus testis TaxID=1622072 RepID=UPI00067EC98E|nr:YceD family protein [Bacillus testis]
MKWTITQLQKYRGKGLVLDEKVDVSEIKETDAQIRDVSLIHVTGKADVNATNITFHIHLSGVMVLPCARTFVDVEYPIDISTTEVFLLDDNYESQEHEFSTIVKGDVIDLMPIIRENLLLEVPMQVFCEDASPEGAAPQSGKDWAVVTSDQQEKKIDPRLADLAKFFDNDKK